MDNPEQDRDETKEKAVWKKPVIVNVDLAESETGFINASDGVLTYS